MEEKLDLEMIAMTLIGRAGESKSLAYQALTAAKEHEIQTDLIVKEAGGEKIDVGLIMVHSQDHLMGAILFKDLVREFIDLYKKL